MAVTLALAKQQCRVLHDREDDLINVYLSAARAWVESFTGVKLAELEVATPDLDAAILLLVAEMYANREAGVVTPAGNAAVEALCLPYRSVHV